MTEPTPPDNPDDQLAAIEATEARTVARLRAERAVPAPAFRGELRRRLDSAPRPRAVLGGFSLRALAAGYLGAGLILLAVAAAGLAGGGPFAS